MTAEDRRGVLALVRAGISRAAVAHGYGVSEERIVEEIDKLKARNCRSREWARKRYGYLTVKQKVSDEQCEIIRARLTAGTPQSAVGAEFGLSQSQVSRIARGRRR